MTDKIPESFWDVLKARYKEMPKDGVILIGAGEELTKAKALEEIEKRSEVGELLARIELNYVRLFKEEAEWAKQ